MDIKYTSSKISKELFFDVPNNVLLLFLRYLEKCKQQSSTPKNEYLYSYLNRILQRFFLNKYFSFLELYNKKFKFKVSILCKSLSDGSGDFSGAMKAVNVFLPYVEHVKLYVVGSHNINDSELLLKKYGDVSENEFEKILSTKEFPNLPNLYSKWNIYKQKETREVQNCMSLARKFSKKFSYIYYSTFNEYMEEFSDMDKYWFDSDLRLVTPVPCSSGSGEDDGFFNLTNCVGGIQRHLDAMFYLKSNEETVSTESINHTKLEESLPSSPKIITISQYSFNECNYLSSNCSAYKDAPILWGEVDSYDKGLYKHFENINGTKIDIEKDLQTLDQCAKETKFGKYSGGLSPLDLGIYVNTVNYLKLNDKKSLLLAYKKELKVKRGLYFDHVFMTYYHFYKFQERFISFISLMYNRTPSRKILVVMAGSIGDGGDKYISHLLEKKYIEETKEEINFESFKESGRKIYKYTDEYVSAVEKSSDLGDGIKVNLKNIYLTNFRYDYNEMLDLQKVSEPFVGTSGDNSTSEAVMANKVVLPEGIGNQMCFIYSYIQLCEANNLKKIANIIKKYLCLDLPPGYIFTTNTSSPGIPGRNNLRNFGMFDNQENNINIFNASKPYLTSCDFNIDMNVLYEQLPEIYKEVSKASTIIFNEYNWSTSLLGLLIKQKSSIEYDLKELENNVITDTLDYFKANLLEYLRILGNGDRHISPSQKKLFGDDSLRYVSDLDNVISTIIENDIGRIMKSKKSKKGKKKKTKGKTSKRTLSAKKSIKEKK